MEIAPQKFCFGRWQLDLQRRTLCADGTPVDLRGRGFDLLALLVEHAGEPVTREAIFAKVWPNLTVGESNLTVQISNLRKVLGENADRFRPDRHRAGARLQIRRRGDGAPRGSHIEKPGGHCRTAAAIHRGTAATPRHAPQTLGYDSRRRRSHLSTSA